MKVTRQISAVLFVAALAATAASAQQISRTIIINGNGSWMGVSVADVTSQNMSSLKLKEERGVEVLVVTPDSPAAKAGIKEHDVILDFNGSRVEGRDQFKRMISEMPAGRTVKLAISRDGVPQ